MSPDFKISQTVRDWPKNSLKVKFQLLGTVPFKLVIFSFAS